jgi:hypothetical protein
LVSVPDRDFGSFEIIDLTPITILNTKNYQITYKGNPSSITKETLQLYPGPLNLRGDDTTGMYVDDQGRKQYFIVGHKELRKIVKSNIDNLVAKMGVSGPIGIPSFYLDDYIKAATIAHRNWQACLAIVMGGSIAVLILMPTSLLWLIITYMMLAGLNVYYVVKEGNLAHPLINVLVSFGILTFCLVARRLRYLAKTAQS